MRSILLGLPERNAEEHRRQHSRSALAKLCAKIAVCLEPKWLQGVHERKIPKHRFWHLVRCSPRPPTTGGAGEDAADELEEGLKETTGR